MKRLILLWIFTLLFSSFTAISWVNSESPPPSEVEAKKQFALMFLERVLEINVSAYMLNFSYTYTSKMYGYDEIWSFNLNLMREGENLTANFMFIHGYMVEVMCYSTEPLSIRQGKTVLTVAEEILESYMLNFNASYCSQFIQFLDQVVPDEDQTIRIADLVLYVSSNGQNLGWAYSPNSIQCREKSFFIHVPNDKYMIEIVDYWGIYPIGSTKINLSKEQAISIALPYIQQYVQEKNRVIESLDAELHFDRDWDGTRGDIYIIYPEWTVDANFTESASDPWVFGYTVSIWADTGQVSRSIPQCMSGEVGTEPSSYLQAIIIAAILAPVTGVIFIVYKRKHKRK